MTRQCRNAHGAVQHHVQGRDVEILLLESFRLSPSRCLALPVLTLSMLFPNFFFPKLFAAVANELNLRPLITHYTRCKASMCVVAGITPYVDGRRFA